MVPVIRNLGVVALAALLGACATTPENAASPRESSVLAEAALPVLPEHRLAVDDAEFDGLLLHREDRAVMIASDVLHSSQIAHKEALKSRWLATALGPAGLYWTVSFIDVVNGAPVIVAEVQVTLTTDPPKAAIREVQPPRPLADDELARHRALASAAATQWQRCSPQYTYSTQFKLAGDHRVIDVRLMPARQRADEFPLSGFHRLRYRETEYATPADTYAQTPTCLHVGQASGSEKPKDVALRVDHTTSETPTEFHVFMSLSYDRPLLVTTVRNRLTWLVVDGKIRRIVSPKGL
ncbi:hypothetical protein [Tahibacter amnicola]|uniref:Conjugative transfer protein CagX n=1 Tax=Tahibacter amnicola TaxID=2976241 RepID=A0ABY6BL99_9GAMM|nr:hypothetical protein [Tahibacter amnicola]UXI70396.1 hypothetical protein N4264_12400 [Tahibacter amnicola]